MHFDNYYPLVLPPRKLCGGRDGGGGQAVADNLGFLPPVCPLFLMGFENKTSLPRKELQNKMPTVSYDTQASCRGNRYFMSP